MRKFSLLFLCLLITFSNLCFSQIKVRKSNLRPYIKVTQPNGGQIFTKGDSMNIRWQSRLIKGNVKIKLKWGTGGGGWFPISESTANDGKYKYDIPVRGIGRHGDQFRIFVMSLDEKIRDASDSPFAINNKPAAPLVDLTCKLNAGCSRRSGKINIKIYVKNQGTRTLRNVLFNYVITQNDVMVKQDGAGFGIMHPDIWYEAKYEFNSGDVLPNRWQPYSVKLFVDPDNKQREPARLRGDNSDTYRGKCRRKRKR
jgi:hypothetical protein